METKYRDTIHQLEFVVSSNYLKHALQGFAFGIGLSSEEAEECVQEAYLRGFEKIHLFNGSSKMSTWLYRIARNIMIDYKRKKRVPTCLMDEAMSPDLDGIRDPESEFFNGELRKALIRTIEGLPADQQRVFRRREFEDLTYREIAEVEDIPEGTVMSRLYYARQKLKRQLNGVV